MFFKNPLISQLHGTVGKIKEKQQNYSSRMCVQCMHFIYNNEDSTVSNGEHIFNEEIHSTSFILRSESVNYKKK